MEQDVLSLDGFADSDNRIVKKRGRKPKGGKLVLTNISEIPEPAVASNIILHLKCSFQDFHNTICVVDTTLPALEEAARESASTDGDNTMASLVKKRFCRNTFPDKKSACFWCTCEFDSTECYIPKYDMNDVVYGYGSFCRPECAAAFLFMEYIDDSVKYERYHLLNRIYGNVGSTAKNIIPSPNPHYALDKFYGSQTIQEYRSAMNSDYMMLVIKNPMTRILPEFHEDCNDFNNNIYGGRSTSRVCSVDYVPRSARGRKNGETEQSVFFRGRAKRVVK
jgi:hypothetical protein